jgi:hypothetical protein
MPATHRRTARVLALAVMVLLGAVGCGDDGTTPDYRVDLVDEWGGTFRPERPTFQVTSQVEMRIDAVRGLRVEGVATVGGERYTVTGRYRPPVIFLELLSPEFATLRYVAEITSLNLMDGTLTADTEEPPTARLLLFRR